MSTRVVNLCIDAVSPALVGGFWAAALGWTIQDVSTEEVWLQAPDATSFEIGILRVPEPKSGKNRIHLDLVADSRADQDDLVDRLISLGATIADIGQPPEADHVVLADPEGNELCVVLRGEFLATTGILGAVVFEPASYELGWFWSEASGWPIVYDQDGETAVRSPDGTGPFITFGPDVAAPNTAKNRIHLDIAPPDGGDQQAEVERLLALGADRVDIGQGDVPWVVLSDLDGNELCVLTPR